MTQKLLSGDTQAIEITDTDTKENDGKLRLTSDAGLHRGWNRTRKHGLRSVPAGRSGSRSGRHRRDHDSLQLPTRSEDQRLSDAPSAVRANDVSLALGAILIFALGLWGARHAVTVSHLKADEVHRFAMVFLIAFVILCFQTVAAVLERPYRTTRSQRAELKNLKTTVVIPIYNEDPEAVRQTILSLLDQSVKPKTIFAVDDGSKNDISDIASWGARLCKEHGVQFIWIRKENGGKRSAQALAFTRSPDTDIFITVDSDALLDRYAIEEGLKPFADPRVKSVAGVVVAYNNRKNLLARITDLWFVVGQLTDRSSLSAVGSVVVNSGPLALYRGDVVRKNMTSYLNEMFLGRPVEFSDDSLLTLYAAIEGRTVQQPTAFVFSLMPETVNHHLRQYLRWMRGSTIRSVWRFKYLPMNRPAYWIHLFKWIQWLLGMWVFIILFMVGTIIDPAGLPFLLFVPVSIGYGQALRYLTIRRGDESRWSQIATILLAPLATLWSFTALRATRLYGMATCRKTGWGTRQSVEVTM